MPHKPCIKTVWQVVVGDSVLLLRMWVVDLLLTPCGRQSCINWCSVLNVGEINVQSALNVREINEYSALSIGEINECSALSVG